MFVIRSMSTTDFTPACDGRPARQPVPYHVYLMPPEARASAWWHRFLAYAQRFSTIEAAQAELAKLSTTGLHDIVHINHEAQGLAPIWETAR